MSGLIHIDERKWPDRPHWQMYGKRLGDDEHGAWLYIASGAIVRRGLEPPIALPCGLVMLIPRQEWWIVEFYVDHPSYLLYANIGTPPVWDGAHVTQIDLDLDVVRNPDGSIDVLDEDEFADHQMRYDYPQGLVDGARAATDQAAAMLEARSEPWAETLDHWLGVAGMTYE